MVVPSARVSLNRLVPSLVMVRKCAMLAGTKLAIWQPLRLYADTVWPSVKATFSSNTILAGVCVCQREGERGRERERGRGGERVDKGDKETQMWSDRKDKRRGRGEAGMKE